MEIADKWFAIVNPVAGSGRGLTDWPLISRLLRERHIVPEYVFTERKYHAIELAVEAVNNGFRKIIVVGGDGTIHEVVNGLFIQKTVPTTDVLSVIAVGTGNDWIRMFGIPRSIRRRSARSPTDTRSFKTWASYRTTRPATSRAATWPMWRASASTLS
ncbi:MAG: acylglycerol kinase family protein [Alistipes ihumii]